MLMSLNRCRLAVVLSLSLPASVWALGHLHADRPEDYPPLAPFRSNDGTLTYVVNLDGLRASPTQDYSDEEIRRLEEAVARAFDTWAKVLAPLNLQLVRLPKSRSGELGVITFDYERLIPSQWSTDSVAGAHSFNIFGLFYSPIPIVFDNTEPFADFSDKPVVIDRPLAHPYTQFVQADGIDIYSVALHEIGHVFGLSHPSASFQAHTSYNFLALDTVRIDPTCLQPSDFLGGENVERRRPLLRTEVDSIMKEAVESYAHYVDIPPEDRAFVAFALRYLNPEGADEILAEAKRLFLETSPLRFANVYEEYEKNPPDRHDNNTFWRAQHVEPNSIILGSITVLEDASGEPIRDVDVYVFDVTDETAGATWVFDVDMGAWELAPSWVDLRLELCDGAGRLLAENDDAEELDEGSVSTEDPYLTFQLAAPGRYYIKVTSTPPLDQADAAGDYELKIGIGSVPAPQGRREVIPALVDPSVSACLGQDPVDSSAVPCQTFGILGISLVGLAAMPLFRRRSAPSTGPQTAPSRHASAVLG
ncbi:MAG: matrixin family metalloprotease [Phycisphaerae bacterium]|nr:matrixin family metalloprotease [Phycisphaerae bacterium]